MQGNYFAYVDRINHANLVLIHAAIPRLISHLKSLNSMQGIKELILLLQQARLQPLQQHSNNPSENPALHRLLEGVSTGLFVTDADAAAALFPGAPAGHAGFFELKSALREKLTAALEQFLTELEQYSDAEKAHIECQKCWLNVRSMSGQNAATLAVPLADRLLQIAEKFDLTPLCMDIALYLRIRYCLHEQNCEQCTGADQKYQHFRQMYDAEFQAEKYYTDVMSLTVNNFHSPDVVLNQAKESAGALLSLLRTFQSPKLHLYGSLVELMQYTTARDYTAAMDVCEKAIRFFQDLPYRARDPLQVFYYQRLICSVHLRQFDTGKQSALACLDLAGEENFNRLKIKELYMLLALHAKQYDEAFRVFSGIKTDTQFGFLPEEIKSTWALYEPYLYFLQGAGVLKMPPENRGDPYRFNLKTRDAASGETRWNSALMAIEFLLLLQQKRYDELLDRAELLENYCQASLDNERTRRSYLFLKMLALIPAGQFQRYLIVPMASPFLAKLKTTPLALANQTEEIEILPYEDLWDMALGALNG